MDNEVIFKLVIGIILTGMGWFGNQIWSAVNELRQEIRDLEVDLPKNYVAKTDFAEAMKEIKYGLDKIYDKLDGKADK